MLPRLPEVDRSRASETRDNKKSDGIAFSELYDDDVRAVVMDIGSESIRAGYATDPRRRPQVEIHSTAGHLKQDGKQRIFLDIPNLGPREGMKLKPIVFDQQIDDWDLFEETLNVIFDRLTCNPKDTMFIFSEANGTTEKQRQKLCELMFEKYEAKAVYIKPSAVYQIIGAGQMSGVVIDAGASHVSVTPVVDMCILRNEYWKADIGGNFLVDQWMDLFNEAKFKFTPKQFVADKIEVLPNCPPIFTSKNVPANSTTYRVWAIHDAIKEMIPDVTYVAPFAASKIKRSQIAPKLVTFPDGQCQVFFDERFEIPEAMFDHAYNRLSGDIQEPTIPEMVFNVFKSIHPSIQEILRGHIVLTGGTSMVPGFTERMKNEINSELIETNVYRVSQRNSRYDAFSAAAMLASTSTFMCNWYSKQEYSAGDRRIHDL